jgi:hypothetical protein
MMHPISKKVTVALVGGGPRDGESFELDESSLEIGHAPYIEFSMFKDSETTQVRDYIHIYAATKPFHEGDGAVILEYAGWFNGLYDPFQDIV